MCAIFQLCTLQRAADFNDVATVSVKRNGFKTVVYNSMVLLTYCKNE